MRQMMGSKNVSSQMCIELIPMQVCVWGEGRGGQKPDLLRMS